MLHLLLLEPTLTNEKTKIVFRCWVKNHAKNHENTGVLRVATSEIGCKNDNIFVNDNASDANGVAEQFQFYLIEK